MRPKHIFRSVRQPKFLERGGGGGVCGLQLARHNPELWLVSDLLSQLRFIYSTGCVMC